MARRAALPVTGNTSAPARGILRTIALWIAADPAPLLSAFGDFLMRFHSLPRLEQSGRLCYSSFCFIDFEINIKKE